MYEIYLKGLIQEKKNNNNLNKLGKISKKNLLCKTEENSEIMTPHTNNTFKQFTSENLEQAMEMFSNISEDTLALLYFVIKYDSIIFLF